MPHEIHDRRAVQALMDAGATDLPTHPALGVGVEDGPRR